MKLRRLNENGIDQFDQFRASPLRQPEHLLTIVHDSSTSDVVGVDIEVQPQELSTRFTVGKYLNELLDGTPIPGWDMDKGIWTWLTAFYFDQLCPPGSRPGERARWVPAVGDFRKYYRHLLAGPYQIYHAHRDNPHRVLALLAGPPHQPGEIAEQLASRQELVTNKSAMEAATTLYIDPVTDSPKLGAAGKVNGGARRLADILNQLDLTWDLYILESDELLELLPDEFDRFK